MKNFKTFVKCLYFAGGLFFLNSLNSCRTDDSQNVLEDVSQFKTTNKVSETLLGLGVKKINVEDGIIKFETFGDFLYRDKAVNFSNYTIVSTGGVLKTNESALFIDDDGDVAITNPSVEGKKLKDVNFKDQLKEDDLILILAYLELQDDIIDEETNGEILGKKISYEEKQRQLSSDRFAGGGGGCSFFNIRRAVGLGFTQAEADADLWIATGNFAAQHMGEGCKSIGGVSHKDVGFATISIQSFCCP